MREPKAASNHQVGFSVSCSEVLRRINKRLHLRGEEMRESQSARAALTVGRYYIVSLDGNCIERARLDLEAVAREEGVLEAHETLGARK